MSMAKWSFALVVVVLVGCEGFSFVHPSTVARQRANAARSVSTLSSVEADQEGFLGEEAPLPELDLDAELTPPVTSEPEPVPPMGMDNAASPMPTEPKCFVGNLNFATDDEDLARAFSEFGVVVSANHVADRFDPMRKRGFGFVTFSTMDEALAAVDGLNESELDGRSIRVEIFTPQQRADRQRKPRAPRGNEEGRRVYVGNLDYRTPDDTLYDIFSEYGEVQSCSQLTERDDPGRKRGFGFVTFASAEDAEAAVDGLDGLEVDGRPLRVNIAQARPPRNNW